MYVRAILGDFMKSMVLVAAVTAALSTAALAADGSRLTGLPAALYSGQAAEGTQHMLPQAPVSAISVAGLSITLGSTALADVATALGGTVSNATDGPATAQWLCYTQTVSGKETYFWFVADGSSADGKVNLVGANFQLPNTPVPACGTSKADLSSIDFSVPGLGASESDVGSRFGVVAASHGFVAYSSQQGGVLQNLNYLIQDGIVVGIAATAIASH